MFGAAFTLFAASFQASRSGRLEHPRNRESDGSVAQHREGAAGQGSRKPETDGPEKCREEDVGACCELRRDDVTAAGILTV